MSFSGAIKPGGIDIRVVYRGAIHHYILTMHELCRKLSKLRLDDTPTQQQWKTMIECLNLWFDIVLSALNV